MIKLDGIFPPIPTPFLPDESLARNKLRANLERLSRFKLAGFLALGSNGEMVMLSESEKIAVYAAAREAIPGDKLLLAGTGAQSTRETITLTQAAARAGADAVLVLNPSYYRSQMTREALVKHYFAVAEASTVPVVVYNMPACSGLDMDAATIVEIAAHENIIGIKDSGGNIAKMGEVIRRTGSDFQFLAGSAGFLLPALSVGAVGGILALANIAPSPCIELYDRFIKGDLAGAREIQHELIGLNTAVTSGGGVPALKAAMDHLGLYGGPPRRPLLSLGDDARREMARLLDDHNLTAKL